MSSNGSTNTLLSELSNSFWLTKQEPLIWFGSTIMVDSYRFMELGFTVQDGFKVTLADGLPYNPAALSNKVFYCNNLYQAWGVHWAALLGTAEHVEAMSSADDPGRARRLHIIRMENIEVTYPGETDMFYEK